MTPFTQNNRIHTQTLSVTTTAVQSSPVFDMTGFESAIAVAGQSATDAQSSGGLKWSVGSASDSLSQTTGIVTPQNASGMALELFRPRARFARADFLTTVTSTGALVNPFLTVILAGNKNQPTTNSTANLESKILYSPGTGTATG